MPQLRKQYDHLRPEKIPGLSQFKVGLNPNNSFIKNKNSILIEYNME